MSRLAEIESFIPRGPDGRELIHSVTFVHIKPENKYVLRIWVRGQRLSVKLDREEVDRMMLMIAQIVTQGDEELESRRN
jgi:hypothetical protein